MILRVEALDAHHARAGFESGNRDLDQWFHDHALNAIGQGTRTFVVLEGADVVVGYFAIAPHVIERDATPAKIGRGSPRQIPAILLAKLALAEHLHKQGLVSELLVVALRTIVEAGRKAGGKLVVVDAIDEAAAAFYRHHDFVPIPRNAHRLVMKISTAARALGLEWP